MIELYPYQKEAVEQLLGGKHYLIAPVGVGKTLMSLEYAKKTGKKHVAVVTTASVRDAHSFESDAMLLDPVWYKSLSSFTVLSHAGLTKWLKAQTSSTKPVQLNQFNDYVIIYDEMQALKAGISSQRGKAFLRISNLTDTWIGMTATPGDKWIDFYAYLCASGFVRNKTEFQREYCEIQTFKGFPEIVAYKHEDELREMWATVSYAPDAGAILRQLPNTTSKRVPFRQPIGYHKCLKTHCTLEGELLDNAPAFTHYMRGLCASATKMKWIAEFVDGLGDRVLIFYNYVAEGDAIEEAVKKILGKRGRVWRIDGKRHEIPTKEVCGGRDVVLCQWQAGNAGLNLQFIQYWVSASPCYSYSMTKQGMGRIYRIGQEKPTFYYFLYHQNTVEDSIYKILKDKQDFSIKNWVVEQGFRIEDEELLSEC